MFMWVLQVLYSHQSYSRLHGSLACPAAAAHMLALSALPRVTSVCAHAGRGRRGGAVRQGSRGALSAHRAVASIGTLFTVHSQAWNLLSSAVTNLESFEQVAGEAALWGNRLAARAAGAGRLLVAHPEGRVGESVVLSELGASAGGRWEVRCTWVSHGTKKRAAGKHPVSCLWALASTGYAMLLLLWLCASYAEPSSPMHVSRQLLHENNQCREPLPCVWLHGHVIPCNQAAVLISEPKHTLLWQCLGQRREQCAGMPLWQLRFSAHAAPELLACRAPYAAAVYSVSANPEPHGPDEQGDAALESLTGSGGHLSASQPCSGSAGLSWGLAPAAALRSKRCLAHLAWNRMLASQLALTCQDGSLHVADVAAAGGRPIVLGYQGTLFPAALHAERMGAPAAARGPGGTARGRAVCEWAPHPRVLLATQGDTHGRSWRCCCKIAHHVLCAEY